MGKQIKTQIGKLGRIVTGKTPPTKVLEYFGDRYPFITPSDISDYSIKYLATTERYLSEKGKEYQKSLLIPENTVCFVAIGSTVGKMCYTKTKSFTNQQIHSIIVDENKYNPHYLYYKIHYEYPKIKSIADANGAGKPIINKTDFSNIEIEVSDLPTQQKIASILSTYDDLIENNTRRIKILEEMAQTIYKEWFVNFRFPGHEKVKFVDSSLGKIPEGWREGCIGDLYDMKSGYAFKSVDLLDDADYPVIKIKNIQSNSITLDGCEYITVITATPAEKFRLEKGDLLIAMTGAQVGKVGLMPIIKVDCYLNQRVGKFFKKKGYLTNNSFIYLTAITEQFQQGILNVAAGAAQPNISGAGIESIKIILPNDKNIKEFTESIESVFNEMLLLNFKNENLRKTRDLLLPKLMSGEVEV